MYGHTCMYICTYICIYSGSLVLLNIRNSADGRETWTTYTWRMWVVHTCFQQCRQCAVEHGTARSSGPPDCQLTHTVPRSLRAADALSAYHHSVLPDTARGVAVCVCVCLCLCVHVCVCVCRVDEEVSYQSLRWPGKSYTWTHAL